MQRLLLFAMALVLCTGPSFAQSSDLVTPGTGPAIKLAPGVSVPFENAFALLYDNGPIQTGTGNGAGGANTSAVGSQYGSTSFGVGNNAAASAYTADDFTVPAGGWTITDMQFFAYQTGSTSSASTITGLFVQIWNGVPGAAGSAVVYGDLTTNVLASSVFSGIFRVSQAALTGATRPIYRNTATVSTVLPAGSYYVVWGTAGSLASGPFTPPITTAAATPPPGNAQQFNGTASTPILDGAAGAQFPVDTPFIINGTAGTPTGPVLSAAPSSVAFGTVTAGTTSAPRTVTLRNSGTTTTTITSITGSGAPFTVNTTGTSLSLAPGASTTFSVTFAPTTGATSTGSVSIVSNAPGSPLAIALTGTGDTSVTSTIPAGTTVGGPTFNRGTDTATCAQVAAGAGGSAVAYRTVSFTVTAAGNYTITTQYPAGFDGYINLYQGSFNPAASCTNRIAFSDDFAVGGNPAIQGSRIANQALTAGTYVLVVTGFANTDAGTYTGTITGPAAVQFAVAGEGTASNGRASLSAAPNPFQGTATVRFTTTVAQDVTVVVYDVTGRQVATLFAGAVAADQEVTARLDGSQLPSGVYVIRATGADVNLTQRVTVVR